MKHAAVIIVVLILAIFVWPTLYTYKPAPGNPRYLIKTNRVLWALNLERTPRQTGKYDDLIAEAASESELNDPLEVVYLFIGGFAMGLVVGGSIGWRPATERRRRLSRNEG